MMNLWSALELGKNSLNTQQQLFQVIGHNIANVNTPGYSRQSALLESVPPAVLGFSTSGRGVSLLDVTATRDRFLQTQVVASKEAGGRWEQLSTTLKNIEAIFDTTRGYGLSDQMSTFFSQWSKVANNPQDIPTRSSLVSQARSFADSLNGAYLSLMEQQDIADDSITQVVDEINNIAHEVASLNEKIAYAVGSGTPAHDLMDSRDLKLQELSKLAGVNIYTNQSNQSVTVDLAGYPLVSFATVNELEAVAQPVPPQYHQVFMQQYGGPSVDITAQINGGQLKSLITLRDEYIPSYRTQLDDLATGLVAAINAQHQQGYALDGVTTDLDFFAMSSGDGQVGVIAGTTLTFAGLGGPISDTLHVGDVISIGGQTRTVTAVTDPDQIQINEVFNPDPPGALPVDWTYFNHDNGASRIAVDAAIIANPELVAASGDADLNGPGQISASAGNTLTFDTAIDTTLAVGNTIIVNGQVRTITAILSPTQVQLDSPLTPPLGTFPLNWSYRNGSGAVGNNRNALALAALENALGVVDRNHDGVGDYGTFHDHLHNGMAQIGNDSENATYELEANTSMSDYLDNLRDSISGVSLDEETTDLMVTEKAYQSIAQFIATVNRMTDIMVQMGRY